MKQKKSNNRLAQQRSQRKKRWTKIFTITKREIPNDRCRKKLKVFSISHFFRSCSSAFVNGNERWRKSDPGSAFSFVCECLHATLSDSYFFTRIYLLFCCSRALVYITLVAVCVLAGWLNLCVYSRCCYSRIFFFVVFWFHSLFCAYSPIRTIWAAKRRRTNQDAIYKMLRLICESIPFG